MNLADTQSARPPAAKPGGQREGGQWSFADLAHLTARPTLYRQCDVNLRLGVLENALTECRRGPRFRHPEASILGMRERRHWQQLIDWLQGESADFSLEECCDATGFDAGYVRRGLLFIAGRPLDAPAPPRIYRQRRGTTSRRRPARVAS